MEEPAGLHKRMMWKLMTSPLVLLPALLGIMFLLPGLLLGAEMLMAIGVAGLGLGVGVAALRLLTGRDKLKQAALKSIQKRRQRDQRRYLFDLQRRLRRTRDDRAVANVKQLSQFYDRMMRARQTAGFKMPMEIERRTRQLYESCLALLERSVVVWEAGRDMATEEARQKLAQTHRSLMDEVDSSVHQLGQTLDRLQAAALTREDGSDLARIREELDLNLQVARRVEERMEEMERDLGHVRG